MTIKRLRLILLSGLLVGFNAYGQPSPAINFLMNQSLSVFDFGLYRLIEDLNSWVTYQRFDFPSNSRFKYGVTYNQDKDKVQLRFEIRVPNNYLYEITQKEKACSRVVTSLRRYFYTIGISKGVKAVSKEERGINGIYKYFKSKGANESGRPVSAMEELENSTQIMVLLGEGKKLKRTFKCIAPLMGKEIEFLDTPGPFLD